MGGVVLALNLYGGMSTEITFYLVVEVSPPHDTRLYQRSIKTKAGQKINSI